MQCTIGTAAVTILDVFAALHTVLHSRSCLNEAPMANPLVTPEAFSIAAALPWHGLPESVSGALMSIPPGLAWFLFFGPSFLFLWRLHVGGGWRYLQPSLGVQQTCLLPSGGQDSPSIAPTRCPLQPNGIREHPGASVVAVDAVLSCFLPWCQDAVSCFMFGCTSSCWVLCVALFPPLRCALGASCRCRLLGALFVCSRPALLVRARGPALHLGVFLVGFPAVACAVTPVPAIVSLCDIHIREHQPLRQIGRSHNCKLDPNTIPCLQHISIAITRYRPCDRKQGRPTCIQHTVLLDRNQLAWI